MKRLGFKYQPQRKSYYTDTHESKDNIQYRNAFIKRYFQYELLCHRWIAITQEESDKMIKEKKLDCNLGYKFVKNGIG